MVAKMPENGDDHPTDELGSELRRAIEGILRDSPPDDLMRRTLDSIRHRTPRTIRAAKRRIALLATLAVSACIVLVALVGQFRNGGNLREDGNREEEMVVRQQRVPAPTLPTAWAYNQASRRSPEAFWELLEDHAARLLTSDLESFQAGSRLDFRGERL